MTTRKETTLHIWTLNSGESIVSNDDFDIKKRSIKCTETPKQYKVIDRYDQFPGYKLTVNKETLDFVNKERFGVFYFVSTEENDENAKTKLYNTVEHELQAKVEFHLKKADDFAKKLERLKHARNGF